MAKQEMWHDLHMNFQILVMIALAASIPGHICVELP